MSQKAARMSSMSCRSDELVVGGAWVRRVDSVGVVGCAVDVVHATARFALDLVSLACCCGAVCLLASGSGVEAKSLCCVGRSAPPGMRTSSWMEMALPADSKGPKRYREGSALCSGKIVCGPMMTRVPVVGGALLSGWSLGIGGWRE